jgi:hypothetical protein
MELVVTYVLSSLVPYAGRFDPDRLMTSASSIGPCPNVLLNRATAL